MMTRGRGGVTIPPKNDDVIYEQPLIAGERFAMVEMKIAMTKLLSKFSIEADEKTKMELRKGDQFFLTYNKIFVSISLRKSHHKENC